MSESKSKTERKDVVILCYHRFQRWKRRNPEKDRPYTIKPSVFEKHIRIIKEEGFSIIGMKKFLAGKIPEKSVIITIDDGFRCTYTKAYPILKKHKASAVIYLYPVYVDSKKRYLTVPQIKKMLKNRIEAGGHSKTHPHLTDKKKKWTQEKKEKK